MAGRVEAGLVGGDHRLGAVAQLKLDQGSADVGLGRLATTRVAAIE